MTLCMNTVTEGQLMDISGFETYLKSIRDVIADEMPHLNAVTQDKLALEVANKLMQGDRDWVAPEPSGMANPFEAF